MQLLQGHDVAMIAGDQMPILPQFKTPDIKWMKYKLPEKPISENPEKMPSSNEIQFSSMKNLKRLATLQKDMLNEALNMYKDETFMQQIVESKLLIFAVVDFTIPSLLILPYHLGIPYASLGMDFEPYQASIPLYPSYFPCLLTGSSEHMTFRERVTNFVAHYATSALQLAIMIGDEGLNHTAQYAPGSPAVSYLTLQISKAALLFTMRAPGLDYIRGSLPNIIDVGQIMGKPASLSNIQPDLRSIADNNGFIMVSFGSWLDQPEETVLKFIEAFASTNLTVIWRLKQVLAGLPNNIKTVQWLPQNDLLGHPNIRAFITHCGGSSTLETVYHTIPVIAFPLGIDQYKNAQLLKHRQFGIVLDIANFEASELIEAIHLVTMQGNNYAKSASRVSAIVKGMPNGGKTTSFCIDHVIQHGGDHLCSAAYDLSFYQYWSLDVIAFLLSVILVSFLGIKMCCRGIYRCVCKRKTKHD